MKRKFEDNEADIITELYAKHFKTKNEGSKMSQTHRENSKILREGALVDDSIGDVAGFNTDIDDEFNDRVGTKFAIDHIKPPPPEGAPDVETYSRPLQDKIRYV